MRRLAESGADDEPEKDSRLLWCGDGECGEGNAPAGLGWRRFSRGRTGDPSFTVPPMTTHPQKLFKYRQAAGDSTYLERTVLHNEIYFAPPKSFNDPFDCTAVFAAETATDEDLMEDYMYLARKHGPGISETELRLDAEQMIADPNRNPRNQNVRNTIQDEYARNVRTTTGIYCVSEIPDDILMWSHYADYHRGVCLEFNGHAKLMQHAMQVSYAHDRPPIARDDSNEVKLEKAILTKSVHWKYEREWRLIRYQQGPGITTFRPENLTGIIVGALASMETIKLVRKLNKARSVPLKLNKASINRSTFTLDIHEIAP